MAISFNSTGSSSLMPTGLTAGTPQKYWKLFANPGTRRAIPTTYLTPALRAQRQRAQDAKLINSPTAQLSGSALQTLAQKLAGAEIDPQVQALNRQDQIATEQNNAISQRVDALNKQYMQYLGTLGEGQSDTYKDYFKQIQASAPFAASDAQRQLAYDLQSQLKETAGKRQDLESQRGGLITKNLMDLRTGERDWAATVKGLDLKDQDQVLQEAKAKADEARADQDRKDKLAYQDAVLSIRRGFDPVTGKPLSKTKPPSAAELLNRWKLDYARKHGHLPSTGTGRGRASVNTPGGVNATNEKWRENINAAAKELGAKFGQPYPTKAEQKQRGHVKVGGADIRSELNARFSGDALAVQVAMDRIFNHGKIRPSTAAMLRRRGIGIPRDWQ